MININFPIPVIIQKQISVKCSSSGNIAKDSLTPKQAPVKSEENSRVLIFYNPISFIDPSSGIQKTKKYFIFLHNLQKRKKLISKDSCQNILDSVHFLKVSFIFDKIKLMIKNVKFQQQKMEKRKKKNRYSTENFSLWYYNHLQRKRGSS